MTDKTIDDAIQYYTTFYNAPKAVQVCALFTKLSDGRPPFSGFPVYQFLPAKR